MSVVQTERLSDKLKEISSRIPEAKVLERKFEKMQSMEPELEATLAKVKKATALPSIAELQAKTNAIKVASAAIEKQTDGAKEAAKEQKVIAETKEPETEEAAPEEAVPEAKALEPKTATKKSSKKTKKAKAKYSTNVDFKKDLMEQASKALSDQIQNNIVVSVSVTDKNGNRICQKGEDEAFDNCVMIAEKDQDADDDEDIKTANQQMGTREYRDANLDLLARSQPSELQALNCEIVKVKKPKFLKAKPALELPADKKAVEVALKVVEKAQVKEEKIIKKVELEKEKQPNGIIDLVSRVLSDNAKVQAEKDSDRQRLEAAIMTTSAAFSAKSTATRTSLESGFDATKELDKPNKKDAKMQNGFNEKFEQMKKDITEAGSGPTPPAEASDKIEVSPITEEAAKTLEEKIDVVEALKQDK